MVSFPAPCPVADPRRQNCWPFFLTVAYLRTRLINPTIAKFEKCPLSTPRRTVNQGHVALGFQKLHLPSGSLVFNGCTIDHGTRGTISNVGGKPQKILSTPPPQILMAAEENSLSINSVAEEGALSRVLWGGRPTEHHGLY